MMTTRKTDHPELEALRRKIDNLDDLLVKVLADRVAIVEEIGRYKKANGLDPLDTTRWEEVLRSKLEKADSLNLCPEFTKALYDLIHEHSLKIESDVPERK